ncbi:hypothetical protein P608_19335 [Comamonas thiooxydans]|uniref:Uncharacterized protein n=1 Tax=Comamonas thiooxydans TaxID=363952 RepID=A0A096F4C4_9BURK|nr:hypothetical protein P367_00100 [Comamonas thiooxydans]KGH08010.1 hypothetical protein P608_19335 [Comamonas thiooxydans]KGH09717.1 hypothetical protein P365_00100 [Comamonas thiooxydans]KGH16168.1 hypothetical protein P368_00100 [Comamonas thiooxydans]KGH16539.1 hypothetical protein P607_19935 [Comamonas thiooxydans]
MGFMFFRALPPGLVEPLILRFRRIAARLWGIAVRVKQL